MMSHQIGVLVLKLTRPGCLLFYVTRLSNEMKRLLAAGVSIAIIHVDREVYLKVKKKVCSLVSLLDKGANYHSVLRQEKF